MSQSRQLAAIMFTDIVGYTALMGSDEQHAFTLLDKSRKIQHPLIERYGGKWIKEMGDGVLASFNTVTDAVLCAILIQRHCKDIPDLKLRIGIHLGDVLFENNDVFGDGVNIAARLLTQARAGSICVSGSVYDNVVNKKGIITTFLREELLKNVKDPIRLYEVDIDPSPGTDLINEVATFTPPSPVYRSNGKVPEKSIAVLPFVNMGNDPEQEYFSDGMAEEILNSLAHIKELKVAGRTSSFQFKGKNIDLREVGEKLHVSTVLEGSVRKQGKRLRITVQLINVDNGFHMWSERYDRDTDDIFNVQDEIAMAVTEKLKITLLEQEKTNINKKPTDNHEAYDLYLKGRFHLNRRGPGTIKGLEYFNLALEKDPTLTLAYTGMADAYCLLSLYCVIRPHDAIPKARQFAEKAIQLQSSLAEAYTSLAFISMFYDWNWQEAKRIFHYIFSLNPNYVSAHYWYSYYLSFVERKWEASIKEAKKASEMLEPLWPLSHHTLSIMYVNAGRFEEGVEASKMVIELDPNSFPGYRGLGLSLAGMGRNEEAIVALKRAVDLSLRQPLPLAELSWAYSLSGNASAIQEIADELTARLKTEYISALMMSCITYFAGNKEKALEYLEQAFAQRDSTLTCIKAHPISYFIRTDPLFQPFLDRINFPE